MKRNRGRRAGSVVPLVVGIDTGGTFTDFVAFDGERLLVHKRLSTPAEPSVAVLEGLRELISACGDTAGDGRAPQPSARSPRRALAARTEPGELDVTYGSTVATNAVLERKGARVVLLTTAGFEDLVEIGRQTRPDIYALEPEKPAPLVERRDRIGLAERVQSDGHVLQALSARSIRDALRAVGRRGVAAVAVCLLHSYANPAHERRVGEAVRKRGLHCSLSHQLVCEYREYERLSTTVLDAYVAPAMDLHLRRIRTGLGAGARLRVMQSNGGAISLDRACREPVRTLLSGPAAGVSGALAVARRLGLGRIITFDMGGTSTDVSLVDGCAAQRTEWSIGGLPVKVPAIDIHTVGAGGGSLAYRDAGGALKVGPQSAGADPGPACYGRGDQATVTDANLVLGRLAAGALLGGRMSLDVNRAHAVIARLARELGLGREDAAEGIVEVVNVSMQRAIRRISVERGHDPRDYALVAFGGAAGLHACELAAGLGITRVVIPHHGGLLSAWGAAGADVQRDYVRTVRLLDPSAVELSRGFRPLCARARAELREEGSGVQPQIERMLDVRYRGQSYEVPVSMSRDYRARFAALHRRFYGYVDPQREVEVVNLRVIARIRRAGLAATATTRSAEPASPWRFRWRGRWIAGRRIARDALAPSRVLAGPLIVTEYSATTLVPPGWLLLRHGSGDLSLRRRERG